MKRIIAVLTVCVVLCSVLCIPAYAETAASKVDLYCTVNSEGDCLVTMTVNLRLEAMYDKLTFPLPLEAKNITLNGSAVSTSKSATLSTYIAT